MSQQHLFWLFSLFLTTTLSSTLFAQVLDRRIYDYEYEQQKRERTYDRYDIEEMSGGKTLDEMLQEEYGDTTEMKGKLAMSPDELRKLGVAEEAIQQLIKLNGLEDSLHVVDLEDKKKKRADYKKKARELAELRGRPYTDPDSLSAEDLQKMINIEKQAIIEKALALPPARVYGHEYFRRSKLKMLDNPRQELRAPDDYRLQSGDDLTILMWGQIDYNQVFTIDEQGNIKPPLVGKIAVRGMTYKAVKETIRQRFSKAYALEDQTKLDVAVSFMRDITAHFTGELIYPGTYRFAPTTSVFNALAAISGPNQLGSVRNITIRRNGTTVKNLDIYEYLQNPNSSENYLLQDNDYVVVGTIGKTVHIGGEVRRPHNYELRDGEGLNELIKFAGGLGGAAFTRTIGIKRYTNSRAALIDVNLDSLALMHRNFALENGDSITIYRVPIALSNYVAVTGAARLEGQYEVRPNDRISDILYKSTGLRDDADLTRAYIIRNSGNQRRQIIPFSPEEVLKNNNSAQNIRLQHLDTLELVSRREVRQNFAVKVSGAVRKEGEYIFAEGLTLKDALYWAGGMTEEAANNRIEISRLVTHTDPQTGISTSERIIVQRSEVSPYLVIDQTAEQFVVQPFDHIFVRRSPDLDAPLLVNICGEVTYPGKYTLLNRNERISSLIERAGGMTPYAFQLGGKLFRNNDTLGYVQLSLDKTFEKAPATRKKKKLRKFEAEHDKYDYILFDSDSIYIPKMRNVVTLRGALGHFDAHPNDTLAQISVPHHPNQRADFYIEQYGADFGRYAKRMRTYVQQPNGHTERVQRKWWGKRYPKVENGATIIVDTTDRRKKELQRIEERKKNKIKTPEKEKDWNKAFENITARVTAVLTLLILIQQATR